MMDDRPTHGGFEELASEWGDFPRRQGDRPLPEPYFENGRRVADLCARSLPPKRYPRIVELGCGPGRTTRWLAREYEQVFAVDIAQGMLDRFFFEMPANVTKVLDDGTHLTEKVGEVDGLFSYLVLMHNRHEDVLEIMREVGRVLAPGGRAFVQLPVYERSVEAGSWNLVGQWTREQVGEIAAAAGLEPTLVSARPGDLRAPSSAGTNHFDEFHVFDKPRQASARS